MWVASGKSITIKVLAYGMAEFFRSGELFRNHFVAEAIAKRKASKPTKPVSAVIPK